MCQLLLFILVHLSNYSVFFRVTRYLPFPKVHAVACHESPEKTVKYPISLFPSQAKNNSSKYKCPAFQFYVRSALPVLRDWSQNFILQNNINSSSDKATTGYFHFFLFKDAHTHKIRIRTIKRYTLPCFYVELVWSNASRQKTTYNTALFSLLYKCTKNILTVLWLRILPYSVNTMPLLSLFPSFCYMHESWEKYLKKMSNNNSTKTAYFFNDTSNNPLVFTFTSFPTAHQRRYEIPMYKSKFLFF